MSTIQRDEDNSIDFEWSDTEHVIDDILTLKRRTISKPRYFKLVILNWSDELLAFLLEVFHHFSDEQMKWNTLRLHSKLNTGFTRALIFTANTLSLFKHVDIDEGNIIRERGDEKLQLIFPGIAFNKRLETFCLFLSSDCDLSDDDIGALSHCFGPNTALKELSIYAKNSFYLDIFDGYRNCARMLQIDLSFDHRCSNFGDETLARIIAVLLTAYKNVGSLRLYDSPGHYGRRSLQAMHTVLVTSTNLRLLHLSLSQYPSHLLECLMDGMMENGSVTRLSIRTRSVYDGMPFSTLFSRLHQCPHLECLEFDEISMEDLQNVVGMTRLPKPLYLKIHAPTMFPEMAKVLQAHPEILIPRSVQKKGFFRSKEQFQMEFNSFGRYLLSRPTVPSSVWALVLENANCNPSLIYELLKGPAFAAR